jgi:G2/mitotic-specific cyclin 2
MDYQVEVDWEMRFTLIDWIIGLHSSFPWNTETLYLFTNILDRFLSLCTQITTSKFQLVGIACFLIALKYEEQLVPSIKTIAGWAENAFSEEEIVLAERHVLKVIDWDCAFPGPMTWMRRASRADGMGMEVNSRTIAKYLMECALLIPECTCLPPSVVASASMWLGRLAAGLEVFPNCLSDLCLSANSRPQR